MRPTEFIEELYPGHEWPGLLNLWSRGSKASRYLEEWGDGVDSEANLYFTVGLTARDRGPERRANAADCVAIPGIWADLDVATDDAKKPYPPTVEEALAVASELAVPTLVVDSGYGVHAYWLFEELWTLGTEEERMEAANLVKGWQQAIREKFRDHGWALDHTHDLARLLRLPGTVNRKAGRPDRPVTVLDAEGPRYSLEALAPIAREAAGRWTRAEAVDVTVDASAVLDPLKLEALQENIPKFAATWNHKRTEAWSLSEHDLALASMALGAGWSDAEACALIRTHRKKFEPTDTKGTRASYLERTLRRAKGAGQRHEAEEAREEALEELEDMGTIAEVDTEAAMKLFSAIVGGGVERAPAFRDLIQHSTNPDEARYVLVTEDGQEVVVGPYDNLRSPRRLEARLAPVLRHVMPSIKEDQRWRGALRTLLRAAEVREEPPAIEDWIEDYLSACLVGGTATLEVRNALIEAGAPFEWQGQRWLKSRDLSRFLRGAKEHIAPADLPPLLRQHGWSPKMFGFPRSDGSGTTTARYWGNLPRLLDKRRLIG